jgi:hypothetical protein
MDNWLEPKPYRLDSPEFARLHGNGVMPCDYIGNLVIGGEHSAVVAHRFRAIANSAIKSIKPYWVAHPSGYSAGNGGTIRIRIFPDADGIPNLDAEPLGSATFVPKLVAGEFPKGEPYDQSIHNTTMFSSCAPLQTGKLYHVVYDNIAKDPIASYISVNHTAMDISRGDIREWISGDDWGVALRLLDEESGRAQWTEATNKVYARKLRYMPILGIRYADNKSSQGFSLRYTGNAFPERVFVVTNQNRMREKIKLKTPRSFLGLYIDCAALRPEILDWSITSGDGSVLASGEFSEPMANFGVFQSATMFFGSYNRYSIIFDSPIHFDANKDYFLNLIPAEFSAWVIAVQADGREEIYGFDYPIAKTEFTAQHYYKSKWLNAGPNPNFRNQHQYSASLPTVWVST